MACMLVSWCVRQADVAAGELLYMLPGIDMVNHATDPAKRNCELVIKDGAGKQVDFGHLQHSHDCQSSHSFVMLAGAPCIS